MAWTDYLLPSLEWQSLTPELILFLFAILAPIVGLWDTDRKGMRQFALIGLGGSFLLSIGSLFEWNFNIPLINLRFTLEYLGSNPKGVYAITEASQLLKALLTGVAFLAVFGQGRPFKAVRQVEEEDHGEFHSLILFATLGMMIVTSAQDLFLLFLGIEISSMCSYLLSGFKRDRLGAEASLKYFTIGAVSSGMTLFAISILYGMTGSTNIHAIGAAITAGDFDVMSLIPIVMMLAGLGFKISAVPFHAWAPDVYSGAPAPVVGMLAAGSKAMGFVAFIQVFLVALMGVKANWELVVALVAIASMTVGNLVALRQNSITRMLAYSSIAQAGYLLIAIAVGTWYAVGGGIFHLMVNAAMKLGAFLLVGALLTLGVPDHVDGYRNMRTRAPFVALTMTLLLLSMAGFPPLGGFASKFILFSGAVDAGVTQGLGWLVILAVVAVINSAISLYYYWRVIRAMYVDDGESTPLAISGQTKIAVGICTLLVVVMGLYPQPFVDASMSAARSLLGIA